jgi:capsular polysaccharide transport system ATP-binding protein
MDCRDSVIELHQVSKWYPLAGRRHYVLRAVDCVLRRGQSVGILGRNGAGKSTLLRLIGGTEAPSAGRIVRRARISWPLGLSGSFQGRLTGRDNLRFVCRIYGQPIARVTAAVEEFSELGLHLDQPVGTYSSGMRARLAFALSMAIEFDAYLVDEITAVGDRAFREKCRAGVAEPPPRARVFMVSHEPATIRSHCDAAVVLEGGELVWYDDVEAAIAAYAAA